MILAQSDAAILLLCLIVVALVVVTAAIARLVILRSSSRAAFAIDAATSAARGFAAVSTVRAHAVQGLRSAGRAVRAATGAIAASILRWWVYWRVEASERAKCPACGCRRKHSMVYYAELQRLVHKCARCAALWMEAPVVKVGHWASAPASAMAIEEDRKPARAVAQLLPTQKGRVS